MGSGEDLIFFPIGSLFLRLLQLFYREVLQVWGVDHVCFLYPDGMIFASAVCIGMGGLVGVVE